MIDFFSDVIYFYQENEFLFTVAFGLCFGSIGYAWWYSGGWLKIKIRQASRDCELSIKREKNYIDKITKQIVTRDTWKHPKIKIKRKGWRLITSITLIVPSGVKKSAVIEFKESLESASGLLLLDPEQNPKKPNRYTFLRASVDSENF